jgi:transposase-like protein
VEIVMEQRNDGSETANGGEKRPLRGSWTVEQKRQIVAESNIAGADLAEVAQRHGVRVALVSSWRRYFLRTTPSSTKSAKFVSVTVDRTSGSQVPPAVWFAYSPDRKGLHPRARLGTFRGFLQADGYAGFDKLYNDADPITRSRKRLVGRT